ncbi:MAG: hypothetical protein KC501_33675 [Myxococcales bacterium]|nr:hypothetical protein [Myxococcales bacterium]
MASMWLRLLTLRYCPRLGAIDDTPLRALDNEHEVLGFREHFFLVDQVPHLLCVVRGAGAAP